MIWGQTEREGELGELQLELWSGYFLPGLSRVREMIIHSDMMEPGSYNIDYQEGFNIFIL